jgi:hypothetical protein
MAHTFIVSFHSNALNGLMSNCTSMGKIVRRGKLNIRSHKIDIHIIFLQLWDSEYKLVMSY